MSNRQVVLVAIKGLGIGGAERLVSEGARFWNRDAYEYHVAYALSWKNQLVPELEALGVPVHLIGSSGRTRSGTPMRLLNLIRRLNVGLVHAHLPSMGVTARLVSPAPVVYTEHNLASSYRFITRLANRLSYWRNTAAIAVSEAVAESVAGYGGPRPIVIPNGVAVTPPVSSDQVRAELKLRPKQPLIVHVGNIRPGKGHMGLIEVARLLRGTDPEAVIVSVGIEKHPGDLERLRRLAKEKGVDECLRFLGQRPDAIDLTSAADILVNPSEVEGLPLAILEAMAVGTPVVATSVGGVPSVVTDRESGRLVEPRNAPALAAAIHELLGDRTAANRMAENARSVIAERHSLEEMVRLVEDVYRQVFSG